MMPLPSDPWCAICGGAPSEDEPVAWVPLPGDIECAVAVHDRCRQLRPTRFVEEADFARHLAAAARGDA